jgi:hypothetical protein
MYGITESAIECRGIHHVARESGFHCMSPVVASRSFLGMPSASTLTRRPAPGIGFVGFGAWSYCLRQLQAATERFESHVREKLFKCQWSSVGQVPPSFYVDGNYFTNALFKIYAIQLHCHIRGDCIDAVLCFCDFGVVYFQSDRSWSAWLLPHVPFLVAPI